MKKNEKDRIVVKNGLKLVSTDSEPLSVMPEIRSRASILPEMDSRLRGDDSCGRTLGSLVSLLTAYCLLLTLGGCGYTIQGRAKLPFQSVSIGKIVNKTFESKIEDKMQVALADELLKNGFTLEKGAEHRIEGALQSFELRVAAEKSGVADQYEVVIKGEFKLVDSSGKEKPLRGAGAFIISFASTGSIPDVMARKELATDQALRDLASEIVASIIYF